MIRFANPELLWLLLLVPATAALCLLSRAARRRRLRRYGNPEVLEALMPEASKYMPWVKMSVSLLAMVLLVIILARPRATETLDTAAREVQKSRGIEVMVCLDVSNSMLASATDDPEGINRLDRAKNLLEHLLKNLNDDKVGLIVFAGQPYTQLPITTDYISARMFINSVSPSMVPTQGTAIGAAIEMAMDAFTPDSKVGKAIIIITDGENFEDDAIEAARRAASAGVQVDVIGMGTTTGAPILLDRSHHEYLIGPDGQPVITALNAEEAAKIAKAGDGVYVSGASSSAIHDVNEALDTLAKEEFSRNAVSPRAEQFPVFAWLALVLLMVNLFTVTRKISWLSRFNFFSRNR